MAAFPQDVYQTMAGALGRLYGPIIALTMMLTLRLNCLSAGSGKL